MTFIFFTHLKIILEAGITILWIWLKLNVYHSFYIGVTYVVREEWKYFRVSSLYLMWMRSCCQNNSYLNEKNYCTFTTPQQHRICEEILYMLWAYSYFQTFKQIRICHFDKIIAPSSLNAFNHIINAYQISINLVSTIYNFIKNDIPICQLIAPINFTTVT